MEKGRGDEFGVRNSEGWMQTSGRPIGSGKPEDIRSCVAPKADDSRSVVDGLNTCRLPQSRILYLFQ